MTGHASPSTTATVNSRPGMNSSTSTGLSALWPHIKLIRILTYYHHDKEKYDLPSCYDGSILPEIEELYYKQKITKRNEWIIDHCDILVCHIEETYKSEAYRTLKYAQKQNKP